MKWNILLLATTLTSCAIISPEANVSVTMNQIDAQGVGKPIGEISLSDSPNGLILTPDLAHLEPGPHGFHIHEKGSCAALEKDGKMVAGLAAGGHFDPRHSEKHEGPVGHGHQGDLAVLEVNADGRATQTMTLPRLKLADIKGRSVIIHEGGDNFSDQPKPLGGGGGRIACGLIQ